MDMPALDIPAPGAAAGPAPPAIGASGMPLSKAQEEEQLAAAIARSLEANSPPQRPPSPSGRGDAGGIGGTEADLQAAIMSSLTAAQGPELPPGFGTAATEPLNPHERVKTNDLNPGLKNIGNTCYVNSMLQTFFSIPEFRAAVLAFNPEPDDWQSLAPPLPPREGAPTGPASPGSTTSAIVPGPFSREAAKSATEASSVHLIHQLQKLFSFMLLTSRKYVDPSDVVKSILDDHGQPIRVGNQEDSTEFTDTLLSRLEEGFGTLIRAKPSILDETKAPTPIAVADGGASTDPPGSPLPGVKSPGKLPKAPGGFLKSPALAAAVGGERPPTPRAAPSPRPISPSSSEATAKPGTSKNLIKQLFYGVETTELETRGPGSPPAGLPRKGSAKTVAGGGTMGLIAARLGGGSPKTTSSESEFGSLILDVGRHHDLYGALDAFTAKTTVDLKTDSGLASKAEKSSWFSKLPPILTLQLRRVVFDTETKRPRKVSDPLTFGKTLYMDRYMTHNAPVVRTRRKVEATHRRALADRQAQLAFLQGYGPAKAPLPAILASTMAALTDDKVPGSNPAGSSEALAAVEAVKAAVDTRVATLALEIAGLQAKIDALYKDMTSVPYSLHAVLVHQGGADAGHYWVYIYDPASGTWAKHSDTEVTTVSEEEVWTWSQGGHAGAAAYCFVYIAPEAARAVIASAATADADSGLAANKAEPQSPASAPTPTPDAAPTSPGSAPLVSPSISPSISPSPQVAASRPRIRGLPKLALDISKPTELIPSGLADLVAADSEKLKEELARWDADRAREAFDSKVSAFATDFEAAWSRLASDVKPVYEQYEGVDPKLISMYHYGLTQPAHREWVLVLLADATYAASKGYPLVAEADSVLTKAIMSQVVLRARPMPWGETFPADASGVALDPGLMAAAATDLSKAYEQYKADTAALNDVLEALTSINKPASLSYDDLVTILSRFVSWILSQSKSGEANDNRIEIAFRGLRATLLRLQFMAGHFDDTGQIDKAIDLGVLTARTVSFLCSRYMRPHIKSRQSESYMLSIDRIWTNWTAEVRNKISSSPQRDKLALIASIVRQAQPVELADIGLPAVQAEAAIAPDSTDGPALYERYRHWVARFCKIFRTTESNQVFTQPIFRERPLTFVVSPTPLPVWKQSDAKPPATADGSAALSSTASPDPAPAAVDAPPPAAADTQPNPPP